MTSVVDRHRNTPEFVEIENWPTLHQLCDGFDENLVPASAKLGGTNVILVPENGWHIDHLFVENGKLTWNIVKANEVDHISVTGDADYRAFEVRPDAFFLDFYKEAYEQQVPSVLDLISGRVLVTISGFYNTEDGQRRTQTTRHNAYVEGCESKEPFQPTTEMIGKHVMYRYTGDDVYEHIYFNHGTISWHCLGGTEKGLADTEPCKMLKLGEKLYLLFWTEKIMTVESVVVVDFQDMRSTGRFFC